LGVPQLVMGALRDREAKEVPLGPNLRQRKSAAQMNRLGIPGGVLSLSNLRWRKFTVNARRPILATITLNARRPASATITANAPLSAVPSVNLR
jgi:hypothetical protein